MFISKALLNTDNQALAEYRRSREIRRDNRKEIEQYSKDINNLKNEVTENKGFFETNFRCYKFQRIVKCQQ